MNNSYAAHQYRTANDSTVVIRSLLAVALLNILSDIYSLVTLIHKQIDIKFFNNIKWNT